MILSFPDLETLRLALASGTVPPEIALAPVQAGMDADRAVWVECPRMPTAVLADLRNMGIRDRKKAPIPLDWQLSCWPQILPSVRDPSQDSPGDKTAVLFDIAGEEKLAEIVGEVLRLGNDRQSFRWIDDTASRRALLRVVGPPYYTLLRAMERPAPRDAPRVYVEQRSRVWSALGYTHPLADRLAPPAGRWLLLGPEREWTLIDEARFRDIYEILEFALPAGEANAHAWRDIEPPGKLRVPLGLARASSTESDELWVLEDDGPRQLDELVRTSDNRLISRLAFAVGERDGKSVVVLRVRPGKLAPPVLVLKGVGYRPYLKLANLFLPAGLRLHPPLRRDAVKSLLAANTGEVTWLAPQGEHGFVPHSLPETAFRPLEDWVDYVLDVEHAPLSSWSAAMRFEFEPFVCREEEAEQAEKKARAPAEKKSKPSAEPAAQASLIERVIERLKPKKSKGETAEFVVEPSEAQALFQALAELEARFQALQAPLDAPERQELWRQMADLNTQLAQTGDASIAWLYALWELESPAEDDWEGWLATESRGKREATSAEGLDLMLNEPNPSPAGLNALAALLCWGAHAADESTEEVRAVIAPRLGRIQQMLTRFDASLPVRAAWLAWLAVAKLSGGDALALARARDRILERLFQHGLTPDRDLPSFLRAAGLVSGDRFRAVRDQIARLHVRIRDWCEHDSKGTSLPWTREYVDLMFAFAHARLGEQGRALEILNRKSFPAGFDEVHSWLRRAFEFRIRQALDGRTGVVPLPPELFAEITKDLEHLEKADRDARRWARYKIEQMRAHSRILEPHERVDPYRVVKRHHDDDLSREIAGIYELTDRDELERRLLDLLGGAQARDDRVVRAALEMAPRLGADFAQRALPRTLPAIEQCPVVVNQALLLERGLLVAAHFDQPTHVVALVKRFHQLLESPQGGDTLKELESLMGESFRGLRKLGMRDDIAQLLDRMAALVGQLSGKEASPAKGAFPSSPGSLAILLQVASGWFFFGQDDRAWPVLDHVRAILIDGRLTADNQLRREHCRLAEAYVKAVGKAPVDEAILRLEDLFTHLRGVRDDMETRTHFSRSKLSLVEAVVLALVSDDFNVDPTGRKWLDDDEFLVRRRIHRDVRKALP